MSACGSTRYVAYQCWSVEVGVDRTAAGRPGHASGSEASRRNGTGIMRDAGRGERIRPARYQMPTRRSWTVYRLPGTRLPSRRCADRARRASNGLLAARVVASDGGRWTPTDALRAPSSWIRASAARNRGESARATAQHRRLPPPNANGLEERGSGIGRGERTRTSDLVVPNDARYLLRHAPTEGADIVAGGRWAVQRSGPL